MKGRIPIAVLVIVTLVAAATLLYTRQRDREAERRRAQSLAGELARQRPPFDELLERQRPLLERAASLPAKQLLRRAASPADCRRIAELVRARYPFEPFQLWGPSRPDAADKSALGSDPCAPPGPDEQIRYYLQEAAAQSGAGRAAATVLEVRRDRERRTIGGPAAEPSTTVHRYDLSESHEIIAFSELELPYEKLDGKPRQQLISALDEDGALLLRSRGTEPRFGGRDGREWLSLSAVSADGRIEVTRSHAAGGGEEHIEVTRAEAGDWSGVHLLPTLGVLYRYGDAVFPEPRRVSALRLWQREGQARCAVVLIATPSESRRITAGGGCAELQQQPGEQVWRP